MSNVDRLPRITVDHEFGRLNQWDDIDWLINEVIRLRAEAEHRGTPKLDVTVAKPSPFEGEEWLEDDLVLDAQGGLFRRLRLDQPLSSEYVWRHLLEWSSHLEKEEGPRRPLTLLVRNKKPMNNTSLLSDLDKLAEKWVSRSDYFRILGHNTEDDARASGHSRVAAVFRGRARELRNLLRMSQ